MKNKKPNLFIVGAPRSGTTAMYEYLKAHPQIYMSSYKSPHYFATDLVPPNPWMAEYREKNDYLDLFRDRHEKVTGEGSVYYLFSKTAAKNIYKFNPKSKIIIMLRNPIEVMYSIYYSLYYGGWEEMKTFGKALDAEKFRKKGKKMPRNPSPFLPREGYLYTDTVKYSDQVKRYLSLFSKGQIKIIFFEDFIKDTERVYKETLKFLAVDTNFKARFARINSNGSFRIKVLNDALNKTGFFLGSHFPPLVRILKPLYKAFLMLNWKETRMPRMDLKLEKELKKRFRPEIKKLEKIVGKELSSWV